MRRRRLGHNEDDTEINLTPMLDVTFIMLIFFIVTSSFVKEAGIDVSKPAAVTAITSDICAALRAAATRGDMSQPYDECMKTM